MLGSAHPVCHSVPVIDTDDPAPEVRLQSMQNLDVALVLDDGEFRQDLDTRAHIAVSVDSYVEAPFAVNKADDPLGIELHWERTRT